MNRRRSLILFAVLPVVAAGCDNETNPLGPGLDDTRAPLSNAATERIVVCHVDRDSGEYQPIVVAAPAVRAHTRHGDGTPGGKVPNSNGSIFNQDCSTSTLIDFETFPDGSSTCDFCLVDIQYEQRGAVFEPFARILNVTAYEPSEAPVNHAVGIGLRRATRVFSITLVRKPKVVEFQATSNSLAPPLNVRALDDDGSELEVSIVSTTYVTRLGFTFRRDHFTVTSSTGVASLEVDESTNLRFGYYVDDLLLVE